MAGCVRCGWTKTTLRCSTKTSRHWNTSSSGLTSIPSKGCGKNRWGRGDRELGEGGRERGGSYACENWLIPCSRSDHECALNRMHLQSVLNGLLFQTRRFWSLFLSTFEHFIWKHGCIKDFPLKVKGKYMLLKISQYVSLSVCRSAQVYRWNSWVPSRSVCVWESFQC